MVTALPAGGHRVGFVVAGPGGAVQRPLGAGVVACVRSLPSQNRQGYFRVGDRYANRIDEIKRARNRC